VSLLRDGSVVTSRRHHARWHVKARSEDGAGTVVALAKHLGVMASQVQAALNPTVLVPLTGKPLHIQTVSGAAWFGAKRRG
jgi:hypothetical protein